MEESLGISLEETGRRNDVPGMEIVRSED